MMKGAISVLRESYKLQKYSRLSIPQLNSVCIRRTDSLTLACVKRTLKSAIYE